ncbi:MAG: polyvinyl alcohol dehydrogenase (cytochrome) [Flavobacterium sp.]|jgi:polyvinyl alcohol dehydrogenase (cytochrome)
MKNSPLFALTLILNFTLLAQQSIAADCKNTRKTPGLSTFYSDGWGIEKTNTRFQGQAKTSLSAANVSQLKLKWVYGFSTHQPRSFPLVTEDTMFIADGEKLVALDRETGCVRWQYSEKGDIGTAIVHRIIEDQVNLYFSDRMNGVVAVNALDGQQLWYESPGDNPVPMYSGTPLVDDENVYVPLSSMEIALVINPFYGCCTTSGGMASLDSQTGELNWYIRSVPELPHKTGSHFLLVEEYGPSGAPVWGTPTLDKKRSTLYFGTGQNYSRPASETSDAIFAVNTKDGSTRWIHQFTKGDAYNLACNVSEDHVNCPQPVGPDIDFGAPPILATMKNGKDILLAGQKSGDVHAMDPDTGELIWQTMGIGRGGALGGIHWGMAVNPNKEMLFVPISDVFTGPLTGDGDGQPGLFALDLNNGAIAWQYVRKPRCAEQTCAAGLSAAITATSELVFTSSLDGFIEVLAASDGELLWSFDTWKSFSAVNNIPTNGGSFDSHGPMVADDLLIISSGYGTFGQKGGNALLVFQLSGAVL